MRVLVLEKERKSRSLNDHTKVGRGREKNKRQTEKDFRRDIYTRIYTCESEERRETRACAPA